MLQLKLKGSTEGKKKFANAIYETGFELFGVKEKGVMRPKTIKTENRRERRIRQLRTEKNDTIQYNTIQYNTIQYNTIQ